MISFFERNGARKCNPDENPFILLTEVIGAGASTTSEIDWNNVWANSPEREENYNEIDRIHKEGRARPPVTTEHPPEFSTPWVHQMTTLLIRNFQTYWRDPTYLFAKFALNIVAGLFIGFTFFQAEDSMQGTQNKLFSFFMSHVLSVPLANQLQVPFIAMRNIYEIRERPSRMYSWTALVTSQILIEVPFNIIGSSLYFLCFYWTVGLPSDRAGYTYLVIGVIFPIHYGTVGQAVASMAPDANTAALLFSALFTFVITFDGVLRPFSKLEWWSWMWYASPYQWLVEGVVSQAIGKNQLTCGDLEYVKLDPPSGLTCSQYLQSFISRVGGYVLNENATSECRYCNFRTTDEFLSTNFVILYSHRWRNIGIFIAYTIINIPAVFLDVHLPDSHLESS